MNCFEKIFNDLNEMEFYPENYGKIIEKKEVIGGEMIFYDSISNCFEKFIVYKINGKIDKVSFCLLKEEIFLSDLKKIYGDTETAYNFRDNLTVVYFLKYASYKRIKNLQIEFDGNEDISNPKITKIVAKF